MVFLSGIKVLGEKQTIQTSPKHLNTPVSTSEFGTSLRKSKYLKRVPGDSVGKESVCNVGDSSSVPGSGRSPGEGNGNPLQYSGLENFMDRGAWRATVYEVTKSQTRLSD